MSCKDGNDIGMDNVGVNFDPANLLIYNQDDQAISSCLRSASPSCKTAAALRLEKWARNALGKGDTCLPFYKQLVGGASRPPIIEREPWALSSSAMSPKPSAGSTTAAGTLPQA